MGFTALASLFLLGEGQLSVPNFEKEGSEKKWLSGGDLKSSCHEYLPGKLTIFIVKKDFEIKFGFEI